MASRPGTERKATASSAAPAVSAVSRRHHEVAVMGGGASGSSLPGQPYAPQLFPSSQEDEAGSSDLVLSDFQGHTRWTTKNNITSSGVAVVLHDMGNLVLRLPNGTIIWQSFDHPTNTILPDVLTNAPWSAAAIARVQPTPIPTGVVMVLWPTSQDACFGQRSLSIWGIIAAMARTSTSGSPTLPYGKDIWLKETRIKHYQGCWDVIASGLKITSPQLVKNYIGLTAYASKLWEDDRLGDRPLMSSVTFTLENESALLPAPRHNLHTLLYGISKLKNEG
ncbi:hypothetical protein VPH35_040769 [Triticum aestivum]